MNRKIAEILLHAVEEDFTVQEIEKLLEKPKYEHLGDVAFPCFTLARNFKRSPNSIAEEIGSSINDPFIQKVQVVGGYINLFVNKCEVTKEVLGEIALVKEMFGQKLSNNNKIVIDFSSPNIAKPFSMGHLRSTVIGNALANIAEKNGYHVFQINHLGDWGTQFGKLIVAYQLWGQKEQVEAAPIEELLKLYVKFHDEAETCEELNDQARAAFRALEENDQPALELWDWFKRSSL